MGFLGDLWDGVKEVASDVWEFGSDAVETGWDFVTDSAKTAWDFGTNLVGGAWDFTVDTGKLLYSFVGEESVSDAWDRLTDDFVENGAGLFNDFVEDIESTGINFLANEADKWEFLLPDDLTDTMKLVKCLHDAGLDDEVVESAVTEIINDKGIDKTKIVASILSNPEIAAELDADKLKTILDNLEKESFSDDIQESVDMVVKNKDVAIELYEYLTEMGMDNRSAMLAAKELITAPDIKTGAIEAIDIVAASGLIKNMNGTFFQDFTKIASKLDIGDYGNSFIEFAKKNSKAIDAINNLLIAHGIDDQTLIQIGNEYLRTEDMNALAEYIFQNEKVQNVLTQYRANFEELAAEQGIPIKDEEMCVNSNGLTNKEMLILSNFEYTNLLSEDVEGKSLSEIVGAYDKDGDKIITAEEVAAGNFEKPGWMSDEDFANMLTDVLSSEKLSKMQYLESTKIDANYLSASAYSLDGKATVAFQGTTDAQQWSDNFDGLLVDGEVVVDTEVQSAALTWVNQMASKYDWTDLSVTGHSKGGNLAQYVTVKRPDLVNSCVSFDGQGFTEEWIRNNQDLVDQARGKITSISSYFDPVNQLLNPIAGKRFFMACDTQGIPDDPSKITDLIEDAHSPATLYSANRDGWYQKDACDLVALITDLTRIAEMLPTDEKIAADDYLSQLFDDVRCQESDIGDKDAIELQGTEFELGAYDVYLRRTPDGFNLYSHSTSHECIIAQLDSEGNVISGDLAMIAGSANKDAIATLVQNRVAEQNEAGIIVTDPQAYMVGLYQALNNGRIPDALEVYKVKDINAALSMMGANNNEFAAFCSDKPNDILNTIFRQVFEDMLSINNTSEINENFTFANWFDQGTLECVETKVNARENGMSEDLTEMINDLAEKYERKHDKEDRTIFDELNIF